MVATVTRSLGLGLAVMLVLAGCARGTGDLEEWVEDVRNQPVEPIEPIPPVRTPEVVSYEAMDLRDPFQARGGRDEDEEIEAGEGDGLRPDPDRRKEYLEGFPLDTLDMVGTLEIEGELYALIRDNENVVHRVREGNYMGRNHGRIVAVHSNRVELRELVQDGRGGWSERQTRVAMAEQ